MNHSTANPTRQMCHVEQGVIEIVFYGCACQIGLINVCIDY